MVDAQPLEDQEVDVEQQEDIEDEEDEEDEYITNDQQRITIVSFPPFFMRGKCITCRGIQYLLTTLLSHSFLAPLRQLPRSSSKVKIILLGMRYDTSL